MTRHLAPTRHIGLLLLATLVVVVLPAADPSAPEAVAQAPAGDPCKSPSLEVDDAYVLPAWADAGGWAQPDQFETIMSGDVDGDGRGELIGRNAAGLEVFTWDKPLGTGRKAYDPDAGQWFQISPAEGADQPSFATIDGWWDPSRYSTFRLADWDGRPGDELLVRGAEGLRVYTWSADQRTWAETRATFLFGDAAGWGQSRPASYGVWHTGDVDGDGRDDLVTRGEDGIEVAASDGVSVRHITFKGLLDDVNGWKTEEFYSTIRLGDVDGDGAVELLARGRDGLLEFDLDLATGTWTQGATIGDWSDAAGWADETYRGTIQVGDVDGDGRMDVMGRSPDGIDARTLDASGAWVRLAPTGGFTDAEGWTPLQNSLRVQLADVLPAPGLEVIGRSGAGVVTYARKGGAWVQQPGTIDRFSDANGWGAFTSKPTPGSNSVVVPEDVRYSTIRPVTVVAGQPQVVIGRDAPGVRTLEADGSDASAPFPGYTDLERIPIDQTSPNLKTLSPEGRAFWYINHVAAETYWELLPSKTILEQFSNVAEHEKWPIMSNALLEARSVGEGGGSGVFLPGDSRLQALNVPRDTYNRVLEDVADWASAVDDTYTMLLDPGVGLKKVIEGAFLENVGDVDDIVGNFEEDAALVALISTLIAGVVGSLEVVLTALGLPEVAISVAVALASAASTGVSAGLGFYNPNGAVDAKASELKDKMSVNFCNARLFVDRAFTQIVGDYGLLAVTQRTVETRKVDATQVDTAIEAMADGQKRWIWQQFGNASDGLNFWMGWCDFSTYPGEGLCELGDESDLRSDPYAYWAPERDVVYKVVGQAQNGSVPNCRYDVLPRSPGLTSVLSSGGREFTAPRQTDTPTAGRPYGGATDAFPPVVVPNNIGVSGWSLGTGSCHY